MPRFAIGVLRSTIPTPVTILGWAFPRIWVHVCGALLRTLTYFTSDQKFDTYRGASLPCPHQGPWFKITWIFVHQRKQWIRAQSGLIRSFDASWLEWSWIINLDPDLPREMHLTCIVQARSYLVTALACINILMLGYVVIQHPIH